MRIAIAAMMTLLFVGMIFAQDAASDSGDAPQAAEQAAAADQAAPSTFAFKGGIAIGSDVLLTGPDDTNGNPTSQTWTLLGFQPDFSYGKIGIGLDLSFHFMLYPDQGTDFKLYQGDWVPDYHHNGKSFLDVYLPKILYIRYGLKGEDPIFAKLGSINDLSLGNGFIMSNYSNMLFMPEQRIFGLDVGVDGAVFGFPYVGVEALTGNLARLDVVGARIYARPLIGTAIPILKNMQTGLTVVADNNPALYADTVAKSSAIAVYGGDIMVPLINSKSFPLAAFTDVAIDPNHTAGWMLGFGGRLAYIFTYGAQLRILQDGFIPSYFDANYDIYRAKKFDYMQDDSNTGGSSYAGWYASLGTSLFGDKFIFNLALDGPFASKGKVSDIDNAEQNDYPHLRGVLALGEIPMLPVFFDASYEKYLIGAESGFFQDLVDPTDAVVGLDVNYRTGASVLTLAYNAKWNPATGQFDVTSSLRASMKF